MTPAEWQRVRSILESALELEPGSRAKYLDDACGEASVRLEVESLIHLHDEAGADFLNAPVNPAFLLEGEVQFRLVQGKRIGPYEIVGQIAQGGMGAVYRATRADGQYTQHVALKIVRAELGAEFTAARFRTERQILASLDHPSIAKILDGGTTVEGLPYFVMELIDGLPITEYCDRNKLSIDERLRLFRAVCSAVQHSHQHLVIHRDIKPTNILITSDGVPKLLDFGIAKLLNPAAMPENLAMTGGLWMMTPEYASPEQLRGEVVTTATDVYSLGLVLYELLTGHRAYKLSGGMPHEMAEVVCNVEPLKPSLAILENGVTGIASPKSEGREYLCTSRDTTPAKLQKRLSGDLDNIVHMALRKEASRRYTSVEQFAEDIRRNLEHLPIAARDDSTWYRISKFIHRHRTAVSASVVVALALLGGLAIALYEARVATKQADIARQQRLRAERRFNDVRKLANSLMFEIHDSIRDLPGATPARKLLVDRALEYLDSLAQESKGDLALQRELAAAYDRVGDLLGYSGAANLGDFSGALQSYNKALSIRESSASMAANDMQALSDLLSDYFRLSFVQQDTGDFVGALANLQKALPVAQKIADTQTGPQFRDWLAGIYWKIASVQAEAGDDPHALENFRKAIAIRGSIPSIHLGADYLGLGKALGRSGDISHSLENLEKGTQLIEQLSQSNPTNATYREYLGEAYSSFLPTLERQGDIDLALKYTQKSQKIFEELWSNDRTNALARVNAGLMDLSTGQYLILQSRIHQAIPKIQKAVAIFESIEPKNRYEIAGEADGYSSLAKAYVALAGRDKSVDAKIMHLVEARSWFQRSLQTWQDAPDPALFAQFGRIQNSETAKELEACDVALAKLQKHRGMGQMNSAVPN